MTTEKRTFTDEEALAFHKYPTPGKIAIIPTKPMDTRRVTEAYSQGARLRPRSGPSPRPSPASMICKMSWA